jgi:type VI secretion system protein ImpJ
VPVIADLRRMLSTVLERNAVQIELVDRSHGVRTAVFPTPSWRARRASSSPSTRRCRPSSCARAFRRSRSWALRQAARSRQSAAARRRPALAADSAAPAPVPRGLPYFELDRGGELWKQLEKSGSLALHVAGDFPALELELWAIRQ